MNSKLDYERKAKQTKKSKIVGSIDVVPDISRQNSFVENEKSSSGSENEESDDSETKRAKKKLARKFPRSKVQSAMDAAVDNISEAFVLDLSDAGAKKISTRLYDLLELKHLNISKNKLWKFLPEIQYLTK